MDNIETFHHKKSVVAETVGFRFKAYLFKSIPMFRGFDGLGQHWDVSQSENCRCRNSGFQIRSRPLNICTEYPRLWLSWTTWRRFNIRKRFLQKPLVSYLKQTSSNQYRPSKTLAVLEIIATLHRNRIVVAETVGFWFEADVFKSVPMILHSGCHGQHWDVPP